MNVIINGAKGRMGRILADMIEAEGTDRIAARIDRNAAPGDGCFGALPEYDGPADVVIDFSHHTATESVMTYCEARQLPVVAATTGQTEEETARIRAAAGRIPVFLSANMSIGVALLAAMAKQAASLFPDADIEIVEKHHNQKLDAPSGTALLLARRIQEARPEARFVCGRQGNGRRAPQEIGIHSLRYGSEVGTHEIIISTGLETVTLRHEAENRALFARGALAAARFLCGKDPGLYDMRDMVGEGGKD